MCLYYRFWHPEHVTGSMTEMRSLPELIHMNDELHSVLICNDSVIDESVSCLKYIPVGVPLTVISQKVRLGTFNFLFFCK